VVSSSPELEQVARRLTERLSGVNPAWYSARAATGGGASGSRAEALRALVRQLADLGREAGSGAPLGASPHEVGVHALADQLRVLVADVLAAPASAPDIAARATAAVRTCYDALWVERLS
jgi:hypothetical protein